jgi:hypothetical protein
MKTFISRIAIVFIVMLALVACNDKKSNPTPDLVNCIGCQFLFTENADIVIPGYTLTSGSYRVFWANTRKNVIAQRTFIKAPMQGNSFTMGKADIAAGKVEVLDICPECNTVAMVAVDGYVIGKNLTPGARADQARWEIEAKIIRHAIDGGGLLKDTLDIKQNFAANFVLN